MTVYHDRLLQRLRRQKVVFLHLAPITWCASNCFYEKQPYAEIYAKRHAKCTVRHLSSLQTVAADIPSKRRKKTIVHRSQ